MSLKKSVVPSVFFCFLSLILSSVGGGAQAADVKGVHFPDQIQVQEKTLHLNGIGVHQKSLFNADVYLASLYLEKPSRDSQAILSSADAKKLVLVFLRDVEAKSIVDEWKESFRDHCGSQCGNLASRAQRFNSLITDMREGQEVSFTFLNDGVTIKSRGRSEKVEGGEFARFVLATFIRSGAGEPVQDALLSGRS